MAKKIDISEVAKEWRLLIDQREALKGIRRQVVEGMGFGELSTRTGLSRTSLYKSISANGNPSFVNFLKVCRALDIELTLITTEENSFVDKQKELMEKLAAFRLTNFYTNNGLADLMDISPITLKRFVEGHKIAMQSLQKISQWLENQK